MTENIISKYLWTKWQIFMESDSFNAKYFITGLNFSVDELPQLILVTYLMVSERQQNF